MPDGDIRNFQICETTNERFARLIREGAKLYPETNVFLDVREGSCCAIGAAALAFGYPKVWRGASHLFAFLSEQGIPKNLSVATSESHFDLILGRHANDAGDVDCRLIVADKLERGDIDWNIKP